MPRTLILALALAACQGLLAKDFSKTYALAPGAQISIENFTGDIKLVGYKGTEIEVVGSRKGNEADRIEIIDKSMPFRIDVRVQFPQWLPKDARVDLEVRVPESVQYNFTRIFSFSGNVDASGISGRLHAESVHGKVILKNVKGMVSASSFSGNIKVDIDAARERRHMRFSTISGNIDVSAPADFDAFVDISCSSGLLRADFPLQIQESRYGPGRSARGKLGEGIQTLFIRSVSGRVNLFQK